MKSAAMFAIAGLLGSALIAGAQTTKTTTKIKGHDEQTVSYTGCVGAGTETTSYVLSNAVPLSTTTTVGTSGETQTETTYALVPDSTVALQPVLGHKVQVTGVLAKGDVKEETTTKTSGQKEVKTDETIKGSHHLREFHVLSVKELGQSCY